MPTAKLFISLLCFSLLTLSVTARPYVLVLSQEDFKDEPPSDPDSSPEWDEFGDSDSHKSEEDLDPGSWRQIFEPTSTQPQPQPQSDTEALYYSAVTKLMTGDARLIEEGSGEIETAAESGYPAAQSVLGFLWGMGLLRERSKQKAFVYHHFASDGGNMQSKMALAYTYTRQDMPTAWVVASLVPIAGGVALASATEVSFNWIGFLSAMASNLTNQSRNVLSKKLMVNKEESMDNITLFSIITVMSFFLSVPLTIFMEGVKFTPAYLQSAGLDVQQVYIRSLLAALCFHAYQQVSYMILERVSPVTHSVANCVKRVIVIVSSVIFFQTPVSPINALGTGIALSGVFLYSRVKGIKPKPE